MKPKWENVSSSIRTKTYKCTLSTNIRIEVYVCCVGIDSYIYIKNKLVDRCSLELSETTTPPDLTKAQKATILDWAEESLNDIYDTVGDTLEHWGR
jgi:hypothetical protein